MRTTKQIFEEELSGEPLSQDVVIEVIKLSMQEALIHSANKAETMLVSTVNQPYGDIIYTRVVNKDSILKLIEEI